MDRIESTSTTATTAETTSAFLATATTATAVIATAVTVTAAACALPPRMANTNQLGPSGASQEEEFALNPPLAIPMVQKRFFTHLEREITKLKAGKGDMHAMNDVYYQKLLSSEIVIAEKDAELLRKGEEMLALNAECKRHQAAGERIKSLQEEKDRLIAEYQQQIDQMSAQKNEEMKAMNAEYQRKSAESANEEQRLRELIETLQNEITQLHEASRIVVASTPVAPDAVAPTFVDIVIVVDAGAAAAARGRAELRVPAGPRGGSGSPSPAPEDYDQQPLHWFKWKNKGVELKRVTADSPGAIFCI